MRKVVKATAWAVVFLVCAGVGAYVAAHTDPFPPGVDRPGASTSSASSSPSPVGPAVQRWVGTIRTSSQHDFYVGGSCRTIWRTVVRLRIEDHAIEGVGEALPVGDPQCDFSQAQVQGRSVRIAITGRYSNADVLTLSFGDVTVRPSGAGDLGGFLTFLQISRLGYRSLDGTTAQMRFHEQRSDGNRGIYRFVGRADLRCLFGCRSPAAVP